MIVERAVNIVQRIGLLNKLIRGNNILAKMYWKEDIQI